MPCPNPCGKVSVIVKPLANTNHHNFKQMRSSISCFLKPNKKAFDHKKLLKIFKQSLARESAKSKFTNILFFNSMTLGSTLMLFCKLDKFCGPFGAVPYIGCPTFIEFRLMTNHKDATFICPESTF